MTKTEKDPKILIDDSGWTLVPNSIELSSFLHSRTMAIRVSVSGTMIVTDRFRIKTVLFIAQKYRELLPKPYLGT